MTDSGSFDSGDIIYGVDMAALNDLCNQKCAAAGVAGTGYNQGSAQFYTGANIGAVAINNIVAAYQRAWDASSNKPGTRQSVVSAGGLIYGSLFQNMWTQLGQMVFDPWPTWNESSEAGLAAADIFVCLAENPANSGNEVGQGCGLSGADATLTQWGAVAGATGTPPSRNLDGADDRFTLAPAILGLIAGRNAFTLIIKASWDAVGEDCICQFGNILAWAQAGTAKMRCDLYAGGLIINTQTVNAIPTGMNYFCFWADGTNYRAGFCAARPTKLSDFNAGSVMTAASSANLSAAGDYKLLGGYVTCFDGPFHYIVAAQRCLINNAA